MRNRWINPVGHNWDAQTQTTVTARQPSIGVLWPIGPSIASIYRFLSNAVRRQASRAGGRENPREDLGRGNDLARTGYQRLPTAGNPCVHRSKRLKRSGLLLVFDLAQVIMVETRSRNGVGDIMNQCQRISLMVVMTVLGNVSVGIAQNSGSFHRVTTTTRNSPSAAQLNRTARAGAVRSASRTALRSDPLRPYRARALQAQVQKSQGPSTSSWQQEPAPLQPSPQPPAPARSHNFYPTLRSGLAFQQPLTLTARSGFLPFQTCTGGACGMAAVAHHR